MSERFGFLGPPGTFTQEALLQVADPDAVDFVDLPSIEDVFAAVASGDVDRGMVPIENSVEGTVNVTVDALGFDTDGIFIQREVVIGVRLHLLARPGTKLSDIKEVMSMPHATAQCRHWLRDHLPNAAIVATNSTAEAAGRVAYDKESAAAIGPNLAAQLFALEVIERDVSDHPEAETRFVVIGREPGERSGRDKTSVVIFQAADRPGSLLEILGEFASRDINLTKLESRPTKRVLGEYCFFIDLEGHIEDQVVADALQGLEPHVAKLKVMGSYQRAVSRLDTEKLARKTRRSKG